MKCTLMNKNTPVLSVEYDTPTGYLPKFMKFTISYMLLIT
mgnify:FL=1